MGTRESHQQYGGLPSTLPPASDKVAFSRKQTLWDWTSPNGPKGEAAGILSLGPSRIWTEDYMVRMLNWAIACGMASELHFPILPLSVALSLYLPTATFLRAYRVPGSVDTKGGGGIGPLLSVSPGASSVGSHTPGGGESTPPLRNEEKVKELWWIITSLIFWTSIFAFVISRVNEIGLDERAPEIRNLWTKCWKPRIWSFGVELQPT